MPDSELDEIPTSWLEDGVKVENDPERIKVVSNDYILHKCDNLYYGTFTPQFKHGNCYWFCNHCRTVISPQLIMAKRLAE
jgi:hypothetical protein